MGAVRRSFHPQKSTVPVAAAEASGRPGISILHCIAGGRVLPQFINSFEVSVVESEGVTARKGFSLPKVRKEEDGRMGTVSVSASARSDSSQLQNAGRG